MIMKLRGWFRVQGREALKPATVIRPWQNNPSRDSIAIQCFGTSSSQCNIFCAFAILVGRRNVSISTIHMRLHPYFIYVSVERFRVQ